MNQLHPKAVWSFFLSYLSRWLFLFLLLIFYGVFMLISSAKVFETAEVMAYFGWFVLSILVGLAVLALILYFCAKLTYRYYMYELREDGLRIESGVIAKRYVTIPYDRIQNVDIYRGLIARMLGLSDLQIQTAGAAFQGARSKSFGSEGRLPGVSMVDAEQLRDELIRRAKQSKNQGL